MSDGTGSTNRLARKIRAGGCCPVGSYEHQVPMALRGRRQEIDICIADIVAALNAANIITVASCCGHGGERLGDILLEDGRVLSIQMPERSTDTTEIR